MVSVALLQLANDLLALLAVQRVPGFWVLLAVGVARRMRVRTDIADRNTIGKMATGRTGVVLTGLV